jgi:hypothetical protein
VCTDFTLPSEAGFGTLVRLDSDCKVEHVLDRAQIKLKRRPLTAEELLPGAPSIPEEDLEFVSTNLPGYHLFSALTERAVTLVVENYYFDLDTRSEVGELQETRFGAMTPFTDRYHFFAQASEPGQSLRDFVEAAQDAYLGYSVIRSQISGRLGRSIVPIASTIHDNTGKPVLDAVIVADRVRTAVVEHINLFGVELAATGVTFMEQDGSLLRCAHVSSWICHYSAVLRSAVPRRTTAHFHRTGDTHRALGRRYPSIGLSVEEMTSMLRRSDLPPERLDREALRIGHRPTWADTQTLSDANRGFHDRRKVWADEHLALKAASIELASGEFGEGAAGAEAIERHDRAIATNAVQEADLWSEISEYWIRENLIAAICRYANSGIPTILVRQGIAHTQVIVGYLRNMDIKREVKPGAESAVAQVIVSDDAVGPFTIVEIDEIVGEVIKNQTTLLIPLPNSLWMAGGVAEQIATKLIGQAVTQRIDRFAKPGWPKMDSKNERDDYVATLKEFEREIDPQLTTRKYTVHVFATTGVDLKTSVATRLEGDDEFIRTLATLQLPKYVWVGEMVERSVHGKPSVRGMIVLDATQPWVQGLDDPDGIEILPLFVHIPGFIQTTPYAYGFAGLPTKGAADEDTYWSKARFKPYATGRWSPERLAEQSASHSKIAAVTD